MNCPEGLLYNPYESLCDYPSNVKCGDRVIPSPDENKPGDENDNSDNNNGNEDNNGGDNNGPCNCVPDEAPAICGKAGSDGILIAHEHCDKFYKCSHGKNVSMSCPSGLLYNPYKGWCDYPSNVKCGDRVIPNPKEDKPDSEDGDCNDDNGNDDNNGGDNNGPCNCVPDEAPAICGKAGSDGILIAHEHCDKFYKCSHGKNVSMSCPSGLLYNPYKGWCDYPSNVKCGDRVIPNPKEDKPDSEDGDCNDDNGNDDNNGGDNNGPCNCVPDEAPAICGKAGSDGILIAHEHCDKFYKCSHGKNVSMSCPSGLLYNPYKGWCDYPSNVKCGDRVIPNPKEDKPDSEDGDCNDDNGNDDNNGGDNNGPCNCVPDEAPAICGKAGSDGILIAHEHCDKFYKCSHGKNVSMSCPSGLLYNPYKGWCDYPSNVKCGDRVIPNPKEDKPDSEDGDCNDDNGNDDNNGGDNNGPCNCVPDEAPAICGKAGSDGILIAHEHCDKFYKCSHGKNVSMSCPSGLLYNPYKGWCDYPSNVECGDRVIPNPEEDKPDNEDGDCDDDNGNDDNNGGDDNGPCNCDPDKAPAICGQPGSNGILIAHEHCNKFYQCSNGKNVTMNCPAGLLYNPYKKLCDYPSKVKCGDRVIPDPEEDKPDNEDGDCDDDNGNDDNNGGDDNGPCNCDPDKAPAICGQPGSNGILIAHEHCNKFYQCSNGKNVTMNCPAGLLYNPYKKLCDYPSKVKCGDRVIPNPEEDKPDNEDGDCDDDNGNDDNNGGDDNGPCNCDPDKAPAICGQPGSNGILIAHEHCNKFYQCSNGKNVTMNCPAGLLYNPYKKLCDYPSKVKCGDRVIPNPEEDKPDNEDGDCDDDNGNDDNNGGDDNGPCNCDPDKAPAICGQPGSNGILIAHEHCNKFYQCSNGKNVTMNCPAGLLYNPYKKLCDYPSKVKCGDRVIPNPEEDKPDNEDGDCDDDNGNDDNNGGDDNGPCNCDPDKAPAICGQPGSNGILIAHEHCNKFYQCSNGKNVTMNCPAGLLYNPYKKLCDYPSKVKCGDRVIPNPEEDKPDNEDGDCDDDNGNDDNNGGDDNGPCNCDPDKAPAICGQPGSNGILIAHEHCNKFYQCSNGKNVTMNCPAGLLYNPYKKLCDYPSKVKCGDRVIPNPEEDKPDNEDGDCDDDNGNDDNNGGDDNGPCNCDPDKAPAICGQPGSNGILIAHEHCNKFYQCSNGKNVTMNCPAGLLYNPYKKLCDYPSKVKCGDRVIPNPEEDKPDNEDGDCDDDNGNDDNNGGDDNGPCNCDPDKAPAICGQPGSNGILIAHEHCNKFYQCSNGKNVTMNCPAGLLYNPYKKLCDYPSKVKCGDRVIPNPEEDKPDNEDGDCDDDNGNDDNNGGDDNGPCNCDPDKAPAICGQPGSNGILIAHEHCNKFYQCSNGKNVTMNCPAGLLYNPYKKLCDYPSKVKCGDRVIPDPEEDKPDNEDGDCDDDNGNDDNNGGDDNGPCNCDPDKAPAICGQPGSDGILVAHEHCDKFYKCSNGKNVSMNCPAGLLYNPYKGWCDYPSNVECGDRVIPKPEEDKPDNEDGDCEDDNNGGDNDGPCNCIPDEAPIICARQGSHGILIAHKHCNKFYVCVNGRNVTMNCPAGLFYNPYREVCDFPNNVKCGDRIIVDPEDEKPEEEEDNGNDDNNGEDGNGPCNCNPGEAPAICARAGSDGVFIAHEHCNKFYQCAHGRNVTISCPAGLLYNPYKKRCDYPDNVKCNDRIIPDPEEPDNENEDDNNGGDNDGSCNCVPEEAPEICAKIGSDGTLIAHQYCDKYYACMHGRNVTMRCPAGLLYNPYRQWCDYPNNVKCGDRINPEQDRDTCNCSLSYALTTCENENTNGKIIAHEICDRFYSCSNKEPVELLCPEGLLFDAKKQICDWPSNVDCGERIQ
ncbi:peritrophin 1 [Danaus plexippus plexippus]|uniref:Peritrophin 1 n=1 Tax=Danaus plexippus plexippus TaxID=278856 RepID=A0A212EJK6_DANPL|nr:peritrophin 1 [Danaus plexippus plexippus]